MYKRQVWGASTIAGTGARVAGTGAKVAGGAAAVGKVGKAAGWIGKGSKIARVAGPWGVGISTVASAVQGVMGAYSVNNQLASIRAGAPDLTDQDTRALREAILRQAVTANKNTGDVAVAAANLVDRGLRGQELYDALGAVGFKAKAMDQTMDQASRDLSVSYTHLTLPTICSV